MAKNKDKSEEKVKSASASSKTTEKATENVVANPRLVAALQSYESSIQQTQSYLVNVAEIIQNEQLTKAEVVASIMEARGVEKVTAESQYSRMKKIFSDPETLEALRTGEIDLKTAREKTKKAQKNVSAEKQAENREKAFTKGLTTFITAAKESGTDLQTILNTVKSACKKAGIK